MIEAAIDAGVGAYVVDGLRKERVRSIVDMAISRFRAFEKLRTELDETRQQLADRKLIDRAKGILMRERGIERGARPTSCCARRRWRATCAWRRWRRA